MRRGLASSLICACLGVLPAVACAQQTAKPDDPDQWVRLPKDCKVVILGEDLKAKPTDLLGYVKSWLIEEQDENGEVTERLGGGDEFLGDSSGFVAVLCEGFKLTKTEFESLVNHPRLLGLVFRKCKVDAYDLKLIGRNRPLKMLGFAGAATTAKTKWKELEGAKVCALSAVDCSPLSDDFFTPLLSAQGLECVFLTADPPMSAQGVYATPGCLQQCRLEGMSGATMLTSFIVEDCQLSREASRNLAKASNLAEVAIRGSKATASDLWGLGSLSKLRVLELTRDACTGELLKCFMNHPVLAELYLHSNECLKDDDLDILADVPKLEILVIDHDVSISGVGLKGLAACKQLKRLSVTNCRNIQTEDMKFLLDLTELSSLNLSGNSQFSKKVIEYAGRNTHLRRLVLNGCSEIRDHELEWIAEFTELTYLDIGGTGCTGMGLEALVNLASLKQLFVNTDYCSDEAIRAFRKKIKPREIEINGKSK